MPSKSEKQHRLMQAVKHNPKFAKKVGIPQSVGRDFVAADKRVGKYAMGGGVLSGLAGRAFAAIRPPQRHDMRIPELPGMLGRADRISTGAQNLMRAMRARGGKAKKKE